MKKDKFIKIEHLLFYTMLFVTIVWFFFYINKGIDVTDQAYYLARYKYYFDSEVNVKSMGTFLTDIAGAIIYKIIGSNQVLILSVCSWALYMGSGLLIYKTLEKYVPKLLLLLVILSGSLFSLTWVHVMNYNATSMFIQTLAICILIRGIGNEKQWYLFASGAVFAVNTFFRLPNVLEAGIGICILWYFIFCKKESIKEAFKKIGIYAAGLSFGWCIGLILALLALGYEQIFWYLGQTANTAVGIDTSHGISNILSNLYDGIVIGIKSWGRYGTIILVISGIWILVRLQFNLSQKQKKVYYLINCILLFFYGLVIGSFLDPSHFCMMFGIYTLVLMILGVLYYQKKNPFISTICVIFLCAEAILCIGTNTGWGYQRVFMIFPTCICLLTIWNFSNKMFKEILGLCAVFMIVLQLTVGYGYATNYVYRDAPNPQLKYEITAEEYNHIKTSKERAGYLNEFIEVMKPFNTESLLAYGDFNIGYIITDMKPFFGKVWPDLESYPMKTFEMELKEGIKKRGYPVIVLADLEQDGLYRDMDKLKMIEKTLKRGEYIEYYSNEWYQIYIPGNHRTNKDAI